MKDNIFNLITSPWKIAVLTTSVRLKIFTILADKQMTVKELSSQCRAHSHSLEPLLNACVSMELLNEKNNQYLNSHFSRIYLVEGEPYYTGDFIELLYNESERWNNLYNIIKGDKKESGEQTAEENHETFIKGMNNLGMLDEAETLLKKVDMSGCKTMIDAGGGSGLYSILLCRKYPQLKSTILDKSKTLIVTKEMILKHKESERIKLREADITKDSFGTNIDVVLISDVIYDETEVELVLKNAWNCLNEDGLLIVRGYYSDPEKLKPLFGALFVLNELVFDRTRKIVTTTSLQNKIKETGFKILKATPLTVLSFIFVAKK
jgi:2-polyprenyl-3-methyl-5-hydroxy-6-metoxy-1,4-benzoquinol methylase